MKLRSILCGVLAIAAAVACKPDDVVETPKLEVDKTAVSVAAEAGQATFNVTTNQDWTASADADWVSVNPNNGKASDKAVAVKVTADDNATEAARTATVTVKAGTLSKTVKVTQAAKATTPEPPVDEPEFEVNELYMLGSACDTGWSLDEMQAFANDGGIFTWTGNLNSEGEFRFPLQKVSNQWWPCLMISEDGKSLVYGTSDDDKVVYNVSETGNYTITIDARDVKNMTVELVYNGPVTEGPEVSWSMMGCFVDNLWTTDVPMTKEGEWIVAKNAQFTELTFKIRGNASWNDKHNMGYAPGTEKGLVNARLAVVTAEYSKANLGGDCADIKLNGPAGTYDVYFSYENLEVYVMEPGFKPGEREPIQVEPQEVTYTVVGTLNNLNWNNSAPEGLMTKEGDYYVGKNVPFVTAKTLYDGADQIEFKIVETGTWDGYAHAQKENSNVLNTEIPVITGGENIILKAAEGAYDVYFDKANKKVWVMEPGLKPGETPAEPEPEYTLEGKQWLLDMGDNKILVDLGLYEEDAMIVALPLMDGSGFGSFMMGKYEIQKADATSGKVLFYQYDYEFDEFMDPIEFPYSNLSESVVYISAESLLGDPTPLPFAAVAQPYEIVFEGQGDGPSGAIENGDYWFFNNGKVMAPLAEGAASGVLPAENVVNGASTAKNIFTLTYDADWSYYTIQDSYGRYLGQTDETGNITVTDVLPTDDTYAFYLWCVEAGYGEAYDIYNASYYFDLTYSAADNNWVLVDGGYEYPETLPVLVKAENPVEDQPSEPGKEVFWENDGSVPAAAWSGSPYRFALEGHDGLNECVATFSADVWSRIKSGPFYVQISYPGEWFQIRILDGWWTNNDESGASDINPQYAGLVNNGDGTYTFEVNISDNSALIEIIDEHHLLFAGDGFVIEKLYF